MQMDPQGGQDERDESNVNVQESLVKSATECRPAREDYSAQGDKRLVHLSANWEY